CSSRLNVSWSGYNRSAISRSLCSSIAAQSRYVIETRTSQTARPPPGKCAGGPGEARRPQLGGEIPAGRDLLAQDRPVVLPEQLDELVVGAPLRPVEVEDLDRIAHGSTSPAGGWGRTQALP